MDSKLGLHVTSGPRNDYGLVAAAKPMVVIAVNEGGALTETSPPTVTIYRDTTVFGDAPPGIDATNEDGARAMANFWYPHLKQRWLLNPADYYQATNEFGGNDQIALAKLVAFESRLVELAAADNIRLCVGGFAGGSPGDLDLWKRVCVPLITFAWQHDGIYGRHAYGPGLLTNPDGSATDGNSGRPFVEAAYLQTLGITGGMVITEAGQNAGFRFPGVDAFMEDAARFDALMQAYPVIIGCCLWTYGNYQNFPANIQAASQRLENYLGANAVQPWQPPEPRPEPDPVDDLDGDQVVTTRRVNLRSAPRLINQTQFVLLEAGRVFEKVEEVEGDSFAGEETWVKVAAYIHKNFVAPLETDNDLLTTTRQVNIRSAPRLVGQTRLVLLEAERVFESLGEVVGDVFAGEDRWAKVAAYIHKNFVAGTEPSDAFRFTHWPTTIRTITQAFGNNPSYYGSSGLPGHEGLDIAAPLGSPIFSVADGTVSDIHPVDDGSHAYGIFVRVRHGDSGYETTYGHLQETLVQLGDEVKGGDMIGRADNTGNILSGSSHLHLTLKHDEAVPGGATYIGYPFRIVDPTPFVRPFLEDIAPGEDEVDLLDYMRTEGIGRLYEVQTLGEGQQRHQTQIDGDKFFHTKDSEWEELWADDNHIFRGTDTSPGNGEYYTLRDGDVYGSKWAARRMAAGETFERNPLVINFRKSDCQELRRGSHRSWIKLVTVHSSFRFFTGITLLDVVELAWLGSLTGEPLESYFYSKGFGLVGWRSHDGRQSAISEIHEPGTRPDNEREQIPCLVTD